MSLLLIFSLLFEGELDVGKYPGPVDRAGGGGDACRV